MEHVFNRRFLTRHILGDKGGSPVLRTAQELDRFKGDLIRGEGQSTLNAVTKVCYYIFKYVMRIYLKIFSCKLKSSKRADMWKCYSIVHAVFILVIKTRHYWLCIIACVGNNISNNQNISN